MPIMSSEGFCADLLASELQKDRDSFTAADIIRLVRENEIRLLNLCYVGGDGRLKTLSFVPLDEKHLDRILHEGERVDGSSLFSHIDPGRSDLYVVPRYRTAFLSPFSSEPGLCLMCSYFSPDGTPLATSPGNLALNAARKLKEATGLDMQALSELEFYVVFQADQELYPGASQRNYHESAPFVKWTHLREDVLVELARMGVPVKYGHAEVGDVAAKGKLRMEQHEIEFLPERLDLAADHLVLAKWLARNFSAGYGAEVTFAPKVGIQHAGSGLHVHIDLAKEGRSVLLNEDGSLSETALRANAGMLHLAPALTAFGNTVPTSYLRLMPHHEAPTNICWGMVNRSVLVRVPLGWVGAAGMAAAANPLDPEAAQWQSEPRQTLEYRVGDGSANIHQLLAGLALAVLHGMRDAKALERAEKLRVEGNLFKDELQMHTMEKLPSSCEESAAELLRLRGCFEQDGVFSPAMIDAVAERLASFDDSEILKRARRDDEMALRLVEEFFHVG
jgi:glutamine synthetase